MNRMRRCDGAPERAALTMVAGWSAGYVAWVIASAIIKFTYKGRVQAEVKAAQATETA